MSEQDSLPVEGSDDEQAPPAINPADIRLSAMKLLARREHSLWELQRKLKRRFTDEQALAVELRRLTEENLQSDQRFAESFVRQQSGRGKGPLRLRQDLRGRGVCENEIERVLSEAGIDWCEVAAAVLRKKFGDARAVDVKEQARRSRFMQYRGFSNDHYRRLI